jgi:ketosteroid isomerase-like protein
MSEQQNVALIQKLFDAFGRGDIQTILNHFTDDAEFYSPGPSIIPYAGTKRGRAEIQSYFDALLSTQSNMNLSIDQFVAQGDTVVAIGRYRARVNATGKSIDSPIVLSFHVQDGNVRRNMVLADTAALADSYTGAAAAARS